MRSREACGVVPRKRKEERVASDSRWAAPSKQGSAGKVTRNFQKKRKKEEQRKDVQQVPSAHYFICFKRSGLKTFIVLAFHSSINETIFIHL
jgi:hypothetical protein